MALTSQRVEDQQISKWLLSVNAAEEEEEEEEFYKLLPANKADQCLQRHVAPPK